MRREVSEEKVLTRGLSLSQNMSSENEEVIDATLSGTYRVSGNKIYINTRITGELGESISSAESSVLISSLSNPYMPEETTRLKEESSRLQLNKDRIRKDFKVEVDLNRGDGSLYYHGVPFKIHVMLEKEAFIRVLYRQVNGEVVTSMSLIKGYPLITFTRSHHVDLSSGRLTAGRKVWVVGPRGSS